MVCVTTHDGEPGHPSQARVTGDGPTIHGGLFAVLQVRHADEFLLRDLFAAGSAGDVMEFALVRGVVYALHKIIGHQARLPLRGDPPPVFTYGGVGSLI